MRRLLLPLLLCLRCSLGEEDAVEYITDEDERIAKLADDKMHIYCGDGGFQGELDRATGKSSLVESLGGENIMAEVLKKSKSQEEISEVFMKDYGTNWLLKRGMPILVACLVLVLAFLFCLFSLCRCCAYERPTRPVLRKYAAVVILVVVLGLVICTMVSLRGFSAARTGYANTQCTTARFLDVMLRGSKSEPRYVGLLPLLREFEKAETKLDAGSSLMSGVEGVLGIADEIDLSVKLATHTITLLEDTLAKNEKPKSSSGTYLMHKCELCKVLQKRTAAAKVALAATPAGRLGAARKSMATKMSDAEKKELSKDMKESAQKVVEIKDSVVKMIHGMLEDGALKRMKDREDAIATFLLIAVLAITLSGFLLALCATTSIYRFAFHERDPQKEEEKVNPYNKNIHKYAHMTWCCGFFYIFLAFLLSGVIFAVFAPISGVCVLLEDLDGAMLHDIGPALGMDPQGDDGIMAQDVIDKCVAQHDSGVDQYLLDILFTSHGDRVVTMREKLKQSSEKSAVAKFSHITEAASEASPALKTVADIGALLDAIRFSRVDAMIIGDAVEMKNHRDYADMAVDPRGSQGLKGVMDSSVFCDDQAIAQGLGDYSGKTVLGMKTFVARLSGLGTPKAGVDCLKEVDCTPSLNYYQKSACKAGNRFVQMKKQVLDAKNFRCDAFQDPSGTGECEPMDMVSREGAWSHDCLKADGSVAIKEKTCSLNEFTLYVHGFEARLQKLLKRIDDQLADNQPGIRATMRNLMDKHVLSRADIIANGVTCNFVGGYYQEFIDGACYQATWGARTVAKCYVWCGVLTVFLVLTMYAVWCRAKGNIEHWTEDRSAFNARQEQMEREEEERRKAKERKANPESQWILVDPNDPARLPPVQSGPPKYDDDSRAPLVQDDS